MEDLKNCPFCGSENIDESIGLNGGHIQAYYIECINCAASSEMFVEKEKAIKAWNTRPESAELLTLQDRYNAQEKEIQDMRNYILEAESKVHEYSNTKIITRIKYMTQQALTQLKAKEA